MDDFLRDMDRLFAMANDAGPPPALEPAEVMRRIRARASAPAVPPAAPAFGLPVRFMIGVGSAAAALAVVFAALSLSTWRSLNDPFVTARFLPDVLSFLQN